MLSPLIANTGSLASRHRIVAVDPTRSCFSCSAPGPRPTSTVPAMSLPTVRSVVLATTRPPCTTTIRTSRRCPSVIA